MTAQIVRFKSRLTDQEVLKTFEERSPHYRAMKSLVQKYYLKFPETGEHGAVYVWDSEEAMAKFRRSELAGSFAAAFQVEGSPVLSIGEVVMTLRAQEAL